MANEIQLLTVAEAADVLRCSPKTLADPAWRAEIGVPTVRIGRSVRFLVSDLHEFLLEQRIGRSVGNE